MCWNHETVGTVKRFRWMKLMDIMYLCGGCVFGLVKKPDIIGIWTWKLNFNMQVNLLTKQ